jgi:8-oxo-dGTP pyrophosphatase MutT (NUDIX family)
MDTDRARSRYFAAGDAVSPVGDPDAVGVLRSGLISSESLQMTSSDRRDPAMPAAVKRGVVAIARRGERFLAIRRGRAVAAPGRVCFPGGHVEPGEEDREAVVRECREELQAHVEVVACVWQSVTPWGTALSWWMVELDPAAELVPHPIEVEAIYWMTLEELLAEPMLLEGNREFLINGLQQGDAEGHFGL